MACVSDLDVRCRPLSQTCPNHDGDTILAACYLSLFRFLSPNLFVYDCDGLLFKGLKHKWNLEVYGNLIITNKNLTLYPASHSVKGYGNTPHLWQQSRESIADTSRHTNRMPALPFQEPYLFLVYALLYASFVYRFSVMAFNYFFYI